MTRLTHLEVHGFRGIRDGSLPFDGRSLVLGGGNGTGKSAFVDALEFFYTGSVNTLSGTAGLSLRQHGPHVLVSPQESYVRGQFIDPECSAARWLGGALDLPAPLQGHILRGGRVSFILRRSQLQQFIHAKPAERYRHLTDLVGAEALDRTELGLKRARDALDRSLVDAHAAMTQMDGQLEAFSDEAEDGTDLLRQANETLEELGFPEYRLESHDDLGTIRSSVLRRVAERQPDRRAIARDRFLAELKRGIDQDQLRGVLSAYVSLLPATRSSAERARMLDLVNILRHGRQYVRASEVDECPLCEQSVDARALLSRLMRRVTELEEVVLHQERLDRARSELDTALGETATRLRVVSAAQSEASVQSGSAVAVTNSISMLTESMRSGATAESVEMATRLEDALERWAAWAQDTARRLEVEAQSEAQSDRETNAADSVLAVLQDVGARLARTEQHRQEHDRLRTAREAVEGSLRFKQRALDLAETAYTTFNSVKNAEIQRVYDKLQSDLTRYYEFLHPEEGYGALSISMDPRKRGSSELKMGFHGRGEEDPRAYSSEGHLDSLGLCIFLAFVRRFSADWPLLVLDDVVASVDAAHKRRVASLLFREFGDRQLFITTQDSRWYNDLRRAQEETGRQESTRNLIIESWSLEEGPKIRPLP